MVSIEFISANHVDLCIVDVKDNYQIILDVKPSINFILMGYAHPPNIMPTIFFKKPLKDIQVINNIVSLFCYNSSKETTQSNGNALPNIYTIKQNQMKSSSQILLAEDNIMNQKIIKRLLNTMGYPNVDTAYVI